MVMVGTAVLVLDHKFGAAGGLGHDVDAPATSRRYLSPADSHKVDANFVTNRIQLLRQQRREVCCLTLPSFAERPKFELCHHRLHWYVTRLHSWGMHQSGAVP